MDANILFLMIAAIGVGIGLFLAVRRGIHLWPTLYHVDPASPSLSQRSSRRQAQPVGELSVAMAAASTDNNLVVIGPNSPIIVGPSSQQPEGPIVIGPNAYPTVVVSPSSPVVVAVPQRGAWDEQAWVQNEQGGQRIYEGYYQVIYLRTSQSRRYQGRVIIDQGKAIPFIADPPPEIKSHPKGPCFRRMNGGWFRIEWRNPAKNVDDAILYVEKILDEALNGRQS